MPANIITTDDLREFKLELLEEIKRIIAPNSHYKKSEGKRYLKSSEVMELLGLSPSYLQNLRNSRLLPFSKINGVIFYDWDDIEQLMVSNKKDIKPRIKKQS